ncbi:MAG: hydrolase 2, exosortase A system-associated [Sphingomonadales bacterium]
MIATFIPSTASRIFAIYHPPAGCGEDLGDMIFIPPFAEELNRSRHVVARQARAFAERGLGVLVLDLFGTGDSDGDFAQARWEAWRQDVRAAADWLRDRGRNRIGLWGLRLGGLLAMEVASRAAGRFNHILLWQPAQNGKVFLTQFLRIRMAAELARANGAKQGTRELRAMLKAGRTVEVAGYDLAPELASAIDGLTLKPLVPPNGTKVLWLEVASSAHPELLPGSAQTVADWRSQGASVETAAVVDRPFWTLLETAWAPRLQELTLALAMDRAA